MPSGTVGRCRMLFVIVVVVLFKTNICWSLLRNVFPPATRRGHLNGGPTEESTTLWTSWRGNGNDDIRSSAGGSGGDNDDESKLDWRDVRANLVMQYRRDQGDTTMTATTSNTAATTATTAATLGQPPTWAYDAGDVIEKGSLIVSHPSQDFACGGLRQQYFYKSVVLVIEHTPSFTKGLILNRPTDRTLQDDESNDWPVWYGGDVQGIHSDNLQKKAFFCLHRLRGSTKDDATLISKFSTPVLNDISYIPWEMAQLLVNTGQAKKEDFWLCAGYSGWAPGQLQNELKRENWFMVATDVDSITRMIGQDLTNPCGTDMWVQVMKRIHKESMTTCMPDQKFKDEMLKQWVSQMLIMAETTADESPSKNWKEIRKLVRFVAPGTVVRASSPVLVDEQVFHQSLVLILDSNADMTTGAVLNRPSSKSIDIDGTKIPLRFGGRFGEDTKGMPQIWLHCNHKAMQAANVGIPVSRDSSERSTFWRCSREDAESALAVGLAKLEDFIVIEGVSIWHRNMLKNGASSATPVEIEEFFSEVDVSGIDIVWKLLQAQEPLNKSNTAESIEAAKAAWMFSGSSKFGNGSSTQTMEQQHVQNLASCALDKWIRLFLLKP